jgi:NAD(P)-dependent dehydrogenase (short-subunit alcohol dehydrogenase family)
VPTVPSGTVLVTGASTGIGEATALHLKGLGFDVVGAVRKDEDAPLVGAYNMSKFALEAFSDSLRRELLSQGVDVIAIQPGGVKTPIWRKGGELADELVDGMPPDADRLYGRLIAGVRKQTARIAQGGSPPSAVAEVIGTALTARRPRTRYLVGRDAKIRARVDAVLPARLMDRAVERTLRG